MWNRGEATIGIDRQHKPATTKAKHETNPLSAWPFSFLDENFMGLLKGVW